MNLKKKAILQSANKGKLENYTIDENGNILDLDGYSIGQFDDLKDFTTGSIINEFGFVHFDNIIEGHLGGDEEAIKFIVDKGSVGIFTNYTLGSNGIIYDQDDNEKAKHLSLIYYSGTINIYGFIDNDDFVHLGGDEGAIDVISKNATKGFFKDYKIDNSGYIYNKDDEKIARYKTYAAYDGKKIDYKGYIYDTETGEREKYIGDDSKKTSFFSQFSSLLKLGHKEENDICKKYRFIFGMVFTFLFGNFGDMFIRGACYNGAASLAEIHNAWTLFIPFPISNWVNLFIYMFDGIKMKFKNGLPSFGMSKTPNLIRTDFKKNKPVLDSFSIILFFLPTFTFIVLRSLSLKTNYRKVTLISSVFYIFVMIMARITRKTSCEEANLDYSYQVNEALNILFTFHIMMFIWNIIVFLIFSFESYAFIKIPYLSLIVNTCSLEKTIKKLPKSIPGALLFLLKLCCGIPLSITLMIEYIIPGILHGVTLSGLNMLMNGKTNFNDKDADFLFWLNGEKKKGYNKYYDRFCNMTYSKDFFNLKYPPPYLSTNYKDYMVIIKCVVIIFLHYINSSLLPCILHHFKGDCSDKEFCPDILKMFDYESRFVNRLKSIR